MSAQWFDGKWGNLGVLKLIIRRLTNNSNCKRDEKGKQTIYTLTFSKQNENKDHHQISYEIHPAPYRYIQILLKMYIQM